MIENCSFNHSEDLDHTNDGSVIERRWARNFELIQDQLSPLVGASAFGSKRQSTREEQTMEVTVMKMKL